MGLHGARDFFFIGRHVGYPVALEGALKLKELSYLHAEGYPGGRAEARPHRAHRAGHRGRGGRHRRRAARQAAVATSPRSSRAARASCVVHRDDDEEAAALGGLVAPACPTPTPMSEPRARDRPAPAARVPPRAAARPQRRPAAEPRQDGDGRVSGRRRRRHRPRRRGPARSRDGAAPGARRAGLHRRRARSRAAARGPPAPRRALRRQGGHDEGARRRARRLRAARRRGAGRRRGRPTVAGSHGGARSSAPSASASARSPSASRTPRRSPSAVVVAECPAVRPVLTAAEMRAADEAALRTVSHEDARRARRARRRARAPCASLPRVYGAPRRGPVRPGLERRRRPRGRAPPRRRGARRSTVLDAVALPPRARRRRPRRRRRVRDGALAALRRRRRSTRRVPVLAVDVPSGVDPDTGRRGRARAARHAHRRDGRDQAGAPAGRRRRALSGDVAVAPIGIEVRDPACALVEDDDLDAIPPLGRDGAQVAARRRRRRGLARHARRARRSPATARSRVQAGHGPARACPTCRAGARARGRREVVRLTASAQDAEKVVARRARARPRARHRPGARAIGRGSQRIGRTTLLRATREPVVLDADALHLVDADQLARAPGSAAAARSSSRPHDGEYAALFGAPPGTDRFAAAARAAARTGLHGAAEGPDDRRRLARRRRPGRPAVLAVTSGTPDLATPGSGDVLAGRHRRAARPRRARPPRGRAGRARARPRRRVARRARAGPALLPGAVAAFLAARAARRVELARARRGVAPPGVGRGRPRRARRATPRRSPRSSRPPRSARSSRPTATATARARSRATLLDGGAIGPRRRARRRGHRAARRRRSARRSCCSPRPRRRRCATRSTARLTLTVGSRARRARARRGRRGGRHGAAPVHVKVDTGMHRQGVAPAELPRRPRRPRRGRRARGRAVDALPRRRRRRRRGARRSRASQLATFLARRRRGAPPARRRRRCCTPRTPRGRSWLPAARLDLVRVGPRASTATSRTRPWPACSTTAGARRRCARCSRSRRASSRCATCRRARARATGAAARSPHDARVATVPVGYADGVPARAARRRRRGARSAGAAARSPGVVTMDQLVVECDDEVEVGDEVVLLGRQGDEVITADEWARRARRRSAGRCSAASSRASRSSPSSDPGTIAPMGAGTLEALAAQAVDVHRVPPERDEDERSSSASGSHESGLLVVGEGPGRDEDLQRRAVRRAVRPAPRPARSTRSSASRRGVLLHRERGQVPARRATATPPPDEVAACSRFLDGQLELLDPARRRHARQRGDEGAARDRRGDLARCAAGRTRGAAGSLVPTFHPAYALRGGGVVVAQMRADLVRAKQALAAPR